MPTGPDLIGVGAVNLDYIVSGNAVDNAATGVGETVFNRFDFGSERGITNTEAESLLTELAPLSPVFSPGGSALNTIASVAAMGSGLSVGYVGICGRAAPPDFFFPDWFDGLGINTDHLHTVDELAGTCVSLTRDGQRSLLTTPGANAGIMTYLEERADDLVQYLTSAKVVLVTSFANLTDIHALVTLIQRVKAASPDVLVCCDPGAMWSNPPIPSGVPELLTLADWVLVNKREYSATGLADQPPSGVVVVKDAERVQVVRGGQEPTSVEMFWNPTVLTADEIVDDTGTGDAFAAGLLWALADPERSVADGVQLGMALATEKLRWPGLGGLHRYREIARPLTE